MSLFAPAEDGRTSFPSRGDRARRGYDPSPEEIEVNISARQHEPDLAPFETRSLLRRRRERGRPRALGEVVRISPIGAHRSGHLVIADERYPRHTLENDLERL